MSNVKGVIVIDTNKILTGEDLLLKIIDVYHFEDILNLEINTSYFESKNKVGDYLVSIKQNEKDLFSLVLVVNDSKYNTSNKINFSLISLMVLLALILIIIISMIVNRIILKRKKNAFFEINK